MVYLHQENIYLSEAWHMENRILIIEDDAAIAQTLKLNLECAGYFSSSPCMVGLASPHMSR